ncbi:uncharacterized protein LOC143037989 isoform X2 [Oratosquilla oratoria]|uniref:uncharacterized protein LOC143037989 isoform X2 n=1 Tax=Oratosquilla oratoria TaxID=337810 RepID=UPI003F76D635
MLKCDGNFPEAGIRWGRAETKALLQVVQEFWADFSCKRKKKIYIWQDIANRVSEMGYKCSGIECDRKFRNLKITYFNILQKQMRGVTAHRADYFEDMHKILGNEIDPQSILSRGMPSSGRSQESGNTSGGEGELLMEQEDGFDWSDPAQHLLLDLVLELRTGFSNDVESNNHTWDTIADQMRLEGHEVTGPQCARQWLNLQQTYEFQQAQSETTGVLPLWQFFTRVRYVLRTVNIVVDPLHIDSEDRKPVFVRKRKVQSSMNTRSKRGRGRGSPIETRQSTARVKAQEPVAEYEDESDLLQRVRHLEDTMNLAQRLDRLESRIDDLELQRGTQGRTNDLLSKVLHELQTMNSRLMHLQRHQVHQASDEDQMTESVTLVVPH